MKNARVFLVTALVWMANIAPALAAEPTRVYKSGMLVVLFLAFWALVLVAQVIPGVLILRGLANVLRRPAKQEGATQEAP